MIKAIGFDFDGVILDSEPFKAKAFADLLYRRFQFRPERAQVIWTINAGLSRLDKFQIAYEEIFHRSLPLTVYHQLEREFSRSLMADYRRARVSRDIKRVLAYSRDHFDFCFVSTGMPQDEVSMLVHMYDIESFFDEILGTGNQYLSKLQHFHHIQTNKKPTGWVFVADGVEDMKIAKMFGGIAVGVEGLFSVDALARSGADMVCARENLLKTLQEVRL